MAALWRQNSSFYQKYLFHMLSFYNSHADIKIYLELILSLVTVIVLGVFAIKPTLTTIAELSSEVQQKQDTVQTLDQKITALGVAQQNLDQNQATLNLLDTGVPTSPMVQDYIKQLEAIALQDGVTIESLQFEKIALVGLPIPIAPPAGQALEETTPSATLPSGTSEIPVTVSVSGAYPALTSFLKNIENHRRPMAIDAVTSNSLDSEAGSTIQLSISGRLPYFYITKQTNETP